MIVVSACLGFGDYGAWSLGFRCLGFGVQGLGFRVLRFRGAYTASRASGRVPPNLVKPRALCRPLATLRICRIGGPGDLVFSSSLGWLYTKE